MSRPFNRAIIPLTVFVLAAIALSTWFSSDIRAHITAPAQPPKVDYGPPPLPRHPLYKPERLGDPTPIIDNFPLAAGAHSHQELPPIPEWNKPPRSHVTEVTPLLIGFTRNWRLLQQTVVSYLTVGWPAEDIYIVENTGTMFANNKGQLSLQNPFYLNHTRLKTILGVNIIQTPTLLTFAQLQNFYIYTAGQHDWPHFYWSHMDVLALPDENYLDADNHTFKNLYTRTVDDLRLTLSPERRDKDGAETGRWAHTFYAYDRLTLVNRTAYEDVGLWDTMIPFYGTDCDMYERLTMGGYEQRDAANGLIYDVGSSLDDLLVLYRRGADGKGELEERGAEGYARLRQQADEMQVFKNSHEGGRNFWQGRQDGGRGEPFYRDAEGFEIGLQMTIGHGGNVMAEKWGHRGCNLRGAGLLKGSDAWRVERDWEWWDREENREERERLEKGGWDVEKQIG
ncbi:Endocytosis protein end4 [Sphaceloma murrayae]|uniref:Endocytosis protein end4 n=1 Tax=Sphaceloma murrayae TaxID=2082308 RepID=A0A2K1QN94_9PEZI|nr:Endocytosis protein end4 [Sphaceloma murrayae]